MKGKKKRKVRNMMHFDSQRKYRGTVTKDKTKVIPRKRKYKDNFKDP